MERVDEIGTDRVGVAQGQGLLLIVQFRIRRIQQVPVEESWLVVVREEVPAEERLLLALIPVHAANDLVLRSRIGRPKE